MFPVSDKSCDIADALVKYAEQNAKRICGRVKQLLIDDSSVKGVVLYDGRKIECDCVIVATGGLSYPKTGSDGDGYKLAEQAGHTVISTRPSLVPIEIKESFCSELMGLSLKISPYLLSKTGK